MTEWLQIILKIISGWTSKMGDLFNRKETRITKLSDNVERWQQEGSELANGFGACNEDSAYTLGSYKELIPEETGKVFYLTSFQIQVYAKNTSVFYLYDGNSTGKSPVWRMDALDIGLYTINLKTPIKITKGLYGVTYTGSGSSILNVQGWKE